MDNDRPGCNVCGKNDTYVNIGRDHWGVCDEHRVCWPIGSNLFSSWKYESETDWRRNAELISGYTEIDPMAGAA